MIDPNGCFVPSKPLPFIQKTDVTKHHYVIPTFAMVYNDDADMHAGTISHINAIFDIVGRPEPSRNHGAAIQSHG